MGPFNPSRATQQVLRISSLVVLAVLWTIGCPSSASAYQPACSPVFTEPFKFTYLNGTSDIASNGERAAVLSAMRIWESVSNVEFYETSIFGGPRIAIKWATGSHGDESPFNGSGLPVAHGFTWCGPPPGSTWFEDLHFDDAETWTTGSAEVHGLSQPVDLTAVSLHELGHIIGLSDSSDSTAIITSTDFYSGVFYAPRTLGWDDILGVQALYGRDRGIYHLRNFNTSGNPSQSFFWASLGDSPVSGDWNGDGRDTIGVFRPSTHYWYLRDTNESQNATYVFHWGEAGDRPVVGDWDGNGTDTVGVYRPSTSTFYLMNKNSGGVANHIFSFGNSEDVPVAGDWNEDGIDTIGVYRPSTSTFYLSNQIGGTPPVHYEAAFGASGDRPVVGDWNNSGTDTIGVYRPSSGFFYLRDSNSSGAAEYSIAFGRNDAGVVAQNAHPVSGDWDAFGAPTIGLYQN